MCYTGTCSHENWHTGECKHPGRGCIVEQEQAWQSRNTVYEGYDSNEDEEQEEDQLC